MAVWDWQRIMKGNHEAVLGIQVGFGACRAPACAKTRERHGRVLTFRARGVQPLLPEKPLTHNPKYSTPSFPIAFWGGIFRHSS